jgi:hypothetical protein
MSDFVPVEKGVPIRQPSTANLLLDSIDRYSTGGYSAGNFTIQKNQSILNGFFSRIAPNEIVLNWAIPNVYDVSGANPLISGTGGIFYPANVRVDISGLSITNIQIPVGLYTVAEVLDTIVARLNSAALGATFSITQLGTQVNLDSTVPYRFPASSASGLNALIVQLGFGVGGDYELSQFIYSNQPFMIGTFSTGYNVTSSQPSSSLLRFRYLDIVSNQLTYNQELKDSSTSNQSRDILFRWYLTQTPSTFPDKYGFPIYPTYAPFYERRPIAFPKQIKWSNSQPIGQLQFEVYAQDYASTNYILLDTDGYDWGMTMLVSEV